MSDAQLVLTFVLDGQTSTLDDKKAALALAKECPAEVAAIGAAMTEFRRDSVGSHVNRRSAFTTLSNEGMRWA